MAASEPLIALDAMGGDHAPEEIVKGAVLAARELGIQVALVGPPALVEDLMTAEVVSVEHNTDILATAALFSEKKFHHFPVLENGRLVGQISRRGVIRALQKMRLAG